MKKQLPALLAALLMTGFISLVMVVTSANALLNKNTVDPANSVSSAANTSAAVTSADQAQIKQLQDRINEYAQREQQFQQREQQYQQMLQSDQQQLEQSTAQTQQFQQFLLALQQRGLIRIQNNGTVLITAIPSN
jgi:ABC-type transport system involved in cytochrome bd biosynthesis fused ATPase/permease subunit